MAKFSDESLRKLDTLHSDLQKVLKEVIKDFDFTILWGQRGKEAQDLMYHTGRSKKLYPHSKHNHHPSLAVDIAPWPVNWRDLNRFYYLAGWVMATAAGMGITLRWGGDWDSDTEVNDQTFNDLGHFELVP